MSLKTKSQYAKFPQQNTVGKSVQNHWKSVQPRNETCNVSHNRKNIQGRQMLDNKGQCPAVMYCTIVASITNLF